MARWQSRSLRDGRQMTKTHRNELDRTACVELPRPMSCSCSSQKGARRLARPTRQCGGDAGRHGIGKEHDGVLVARDRESS